MEEEDEGTQDRHPDDCTREQVIQGKARVCRGLGR